MSLRRAETNAAWPSIESATGHAAARRSTLPRREQLLDSDLLPTWLIGLRFNTLLIWLVTAGCIGYVFTYLPYLRGPYILNALLAISVAFALVSIFQVSTPLQVLLRRVLGVFAIAFVPPRRPRPPHPGPEALDDNSEEAVVDSSYRKEKSVAWTLPGKVESRILDDYGFSVSALWPDTRLLLNKGEEKRLAALSLQRRSFEISAALVGISTLSIAWSVFQEYPYLTLDSFSWTILAIQALYAVGCLGQSVRVRAAITRLQAVLIRRNSSQLLSAYGRDTRSPRDRANSLARLSRELQRSRPPIPIRPQSSSPDNESSKRGSRRLAISGTAEDLAPTNVMGRIETEVATLNSKTWEVRLHVQTGSEPWQIAVQTEDTAFRLIGGRDRSFVVFDIRVDPTRDLFVAPTNVTMEIDTEGGREVAEFTVTSASAESRTDNLWATVYSSTKFVQAVPLKLPPYAP